MTPFIWSLLIWLGIWTTLFLTFELSAVFFPEHVPWNTLSWTVWQLMARSAWFGIFFIGLMFSLLMHFAFGFPNRGRFKKERDEGKR